MTMTRRLLYACILALPIPLAACDANDPVQEPSTIVVTGADQTGQVGAQLPEPITIALRRPGGHFAASWPLSLRGVSGNLSVRVGLSTLQGDGATVTVTPEQSTAFLEVTLGPLPGVHSFEVWVPGVRTEPAVVTISLNATAAPIAASHN